MQQLHKTCSAHSAWYREWHEMKHNQLLGWLMFIALAFLAADVVQFSIDASVYQHNQLAAVVETRVRVVIPPERRAEPFAIGATTTAITKNSATIIWNTPATSTVVVRYGTIPGRFTGEVISSLPAVSGEVVVRGLRQNFVYFYAIEARAEGTLSRATSTLQQFRTSVR